MMRVPMRALRRALRLRCPVCGYGDLFTRGLRLNDTCPYCQSRFERTPGESLGGIYLTGVITLLVLIVGFVVLELALDADASLFIAFWIGCVLVFNLFLYRTARAVWIAVSYLNGGVYPDPDYEREYYAPSEKHSHAQERSE
ncbi:MAG: DUF983 domain-containing protein [Chloroflexota bacterium]|nr:DUF983 domain-containing protein [Chloroflexota bacterium]